MERKKLILLSFFLLVCVETNGFASPECNYCVSPPCNPTILPQSDFNAKEDVKTLQTAITKGGSQAIDTIMQILTSRSESQRMAISLEYIATGEPLMDAVSSKLKISKKLWEALLTPLPLFYVQEIRDAFQNSENNQKLETLFEIFTSLPNCAIREIAYYYRLVTGESVSAKVGSTVWSVNSFLVQLVRGNRDETLDLNANDITNANNDGKNLATLVQNAKTATLTKLWHTNNFNKFFADIFSKKSFPYLKKVLEYYDTYRKNSEGNNYLSFIEDIKFFENDMQRAATIAVRNVLNQKHFFARQLNWYLGVFTVSNEDQRVAVRILRSRSEVDLAGIKQEYDAKFAKQYNTMGRRISMDNNINEEYKKSMLAFIKP